MWCAVFGCVLSTLFAAKASENGRPLSALQAGLFVVEGFHMGFMREAMHAGLEGCSLVMMSSDLWPTAGLYLQAQDCVAVSP